MRFSKFIAAVFGAAGLALVGSAALAAPQADVTYRVEAAPSNPHDVFRRVIKVPKDGMAARSKRADCGPCPMMQGAAKPAHAPSTL